MHATMKRPSPRAGALLFLAMGVGLLSADTARAHFLWIRAEPAATPGAGATIRVFLNETPSPGGPEFLKFVRNVVPTAGGQPLPMTPSEESLDSRWVGKLPSTIDAESDLGVKTKGETNYRLSYTARVQMALASVDDKEKGDKLRVRLVTKDGKSLIQVLFDGKPAAKARLKVYPESSDPFEATSDGEGFATIDGLAEGKSALWANWIDLKPGEVGGKPFSETRHYASLTFVPSPSNGDAPTAFATMPEPAVNSFGGAVLGDWLYVYSGHAGETHQYSVETTSRHFRRLNLKDRTTWEELPMGRAVQGVALVSDGKFLYRTGGMSARNQPGQEHDLASVADFARFDPETKSWTDLAPLPQTRSTHDSAVIGRKVYVAGGWSMKGAKEKSVFSEEAAVFDLDAPEAGWKTFKQPFRRRALSVAEAGGKLHVLGGLTDDFKVERRVDVYDPATGSWTLGPDLPGSGDREGFATSAFAVDGSLYLSGLSGLISRLDAKAGVWEAVGAWSQPRLTHRLLAVPGRTLLAVGGNFRGEQTPVIEAVVLPPISPGPSRTDR
jgi:hypothetical protein